MIDEQFEFSISQYLDGTLPDAERVALEVRLKEDVVAGAVLEDYRKLNVVLKSGVGLSAVQWDLFARSISSAVDAAEAEREEKAAERFRMPRWVRTVAMPLATAASVLVAIGVGFHAMQVRSRSIQGIVSQSQSPTPYASISVFNSQSEPTHTPGEVHVAIGPGNDANDDPVLVHYSGDGVSRSSSSHLSVASGVTPVHDTDSLLFDME